MNIVTNISLIRRNARIAQITMFGGLAVLAAGMFLTFKQPEQVSLSFAALMVGFILSQIGIYFQNRWGRSPRPDEQLNDSLKGLDSKYTLYHYTTPVPHLLVGPGGVWVLLPRQQRGQITYSKNRYRQKGGGLLQSYLKLFAQEGIGRPDLDIQSEKDTLRKFLEKQLPEDVKIPDIQAALVFTNKSAEVDIHEGENLPAETVVLGKLKDTIRKSVKVKQLSPERVKQIQDLLEGTEE